MGLFQWMNDHPKVAFPLVGTCVAAAVGMALFQGLQNRHRIHTKMPSEYFSVDDGKTFFTAPINNVPPFDYQGSVANRAYVFECGNQRFVGFLERYKPDARKVIAAGGNASPQMLMTGREIKKPGETMWVSSTDMPAMMNVQSVTCPDHSPDKPVPVEPE